MNLIKQTVSSAIALGDAGARLFARGRLRGSCVVINYHSISDESQQQFGRQLDRLLELAQPIPLRTGQVLQRGKRYVAITVDDVFRSFVENGLPELCRRNIPVTVFPPTGYLGRKSAWADYGGENKVGEEVVSAAELQRMAQQPNVDFGSRTVTHADLALASEAEARQELRDSKASLQAIVGREVVALSFPYGSCTAREVSLAREAGYRFCFDSTPESVFSELRGGLIGRVDVQPTDSDFEFRLKVTGAYRWVRWASVCKKKLRFKTAAPAGEVAHA